jgi:iron(III) transport system ATP-binding protein
LTTSPNPTARNPCWKTSAFKLSPGQIGCLLGPSGCGKTTALRLIAGFEKLSAGEIRIGGELVSRPGQPRSGTTPGGPGIPGLRPVSPSFRGAQHRLRLEPLTPADRAFRIAEMLELVGLTHEAEPIPTSFPAASSSASPWPAHWRPVPACCCWTNRFSNLDVELREKLSLEVRDILKHEAITALLVTHDQHEAFAMADAIGVMNKGVIQQWDTPYNLYHQPVNRFVADFIGQGVLLPGEVLNSRQVEIELGVLEGVVDGDCGEEGGCSLCELGCQVDVLIRPDDIIHDDASLLMAEVERKAFRGADFLYTLKLPGGRRVLAQVDSHHNHALGEKIGIRLGIDHVVAFRK